MNTNAGMVADGCGVRLSEGVVWILCGWVCHIELTDNLGVVQGLSKGDVECTAGRHPNADAEKHTFIKVMINGRKVERTSQLC